MEQLIAIWLTVRETAERLRLSERTVHTLIHEGRLRSVKVGAARRVPLSAIEAFERTLLEEGGKS